MPVRHDRLVYSTGTFHTSVRELLLMDVQKLEVLETYGVSLHIVTSYETKLSIYPHKIFCTELCFTTTNINILHIITKRINCLKITIKLYDCSVKFNSCILQDRAGIRSVEIQAQKTLINTIVLAENAHQ